jgi:hypothetical protein
LRTTPAGWRRLERKSPELHEVHEDNTKVHGENKRQALRDLIFSSVPFLLIIDFASTQRNLQ